MNNNISAQDYVRRVPVAVLATIALLACWFVYRRLPTAVSRSPLPGYFAVFAFAADQALLHTSLAGTHIVLSVD